MVILTITFVSAVEDIAANRNRTTFHYVLCGALSDCTLRLCFVSDSSAFCFYKD